jgi:hypothetical protein
VPAHPIEHGHQNTKAFSFSAIGAQLSGLDGEASDARLKADGRELLENLDGTP